MTAGPIFFSVDWPTCLKPVTNLAFQTMRDSFSAPAMTDCFVSCKNAPGDSCTYWTYFFGNTTCQFFSIMRASADYDVADVVSGEKYCTGTRKTSPINKFL